MKTDCSGLFKCPCNVVCEHGLHTTLIVACWYKPCQNNQNNQWLLFQNWKRNIIKLDFFHSVLSPYVRCDGDSWILIVMWENDVWWRAAKWPHQTSRRSWVKCCVSRQEVLSPGPSWQPTPTPPTTSGRSVQSVCLSVCQSVCQQHLLLGCMNITEAYWHTRNIKILISNLFLKRKIYRRSIFVAFCDAKLVIVFWKKRPKMPKVAKEKVFLF